MTRFAHDFRYLIEILTTGRQNSFLMFHESSMGAEGKQMDIAAVTNHFMRIDKMINKKIERHIDLELNFFDNHSADLYLSSKECYRLGFCNYVGYPKIKLSFSMEMTFEVKSNKRHEIEDPQKRTKYQKVLSGYSSQNSPEFVAK